MTKGTKTLLYVLGGLAVVGAGGTAIYFATKKEEPKGATSDNTVVPDPGQGSNPEPSPTSLVQTNVPEVNAFLNLAQALAQATKKPDFGSAQQGGL